MLNERGFEASTLHALPVVAINEGRILGKVKDAVFDPASHSLIGLTVNGRNGRGEAFVDCTRIRRLGPYAIIVGSEADIGNVDGHERASEIVSSGIRIRGADVMTDAGRPIGKIDRVWIRHDGTVTRYRASVGGFGFGRSHDLTPDDVVVIGEDVVIVSSEAIDGPQQPTDAMRHPDEAELGATD